MKTNRIEEIARAIVQNRVIYQKVIAALIADNHLSDAGRSELTDKELKQAKLRHDSLAEELREAKENERARLERQAFQAPRGQEDAYRHAIEKVSALQNFKDKIDLYNLSEKIGDTLTLKALAAVSHGMGDEHHFVMLQNVAQYDRDVASLIEFESQYGALRSKQQMLGDSRLLTAPSKIDLSTRRKTEQAPTPRNLDGTRAW